MYFLIHDGKAFVSVFISFLAIDQSVNIAARLQSHRSTGTKCLWRFDSHPRYLGCLLDWGRVLP